MNMVRFDWSKVIAAVCVAIYFFYYAATPLDWHFINIVDLIFHEAGHTLTRFFGEFISICSGSGFQILIPTICCIQFYRQQQLYSAALMLFWIGQNFINVSVYAGDSILMQLPLLGGDSVIHDWNYMLSTLHLLKYTPLIANVLYAIGILLYVLGLYYSILNSRKQESMPTFSD